MEGETSWISHCADDITTLPVDFVPFFSELNDETSKEVSTISMDLILPDDLLERILSYLPIASVIRAGSVCRRWNEIVTSKRFLWNNSVHLSSQKPWYFMFTSSDEPNGYAFDPILKKWYALDLPCIESSNWFVAGSCGLVCFMDNESRRELYVCNPITKCFRGLDEPSGPKFPDYSALAISVDRSTLNYVVSVVKSKQVPGNFYQWDLSVHLYDSSLMTWTATLVETLSGWRAGAESVICGGLLCFLIYSIGPDVPGPERRHGLITYDLRRRAARAGLLMSSFVPGPCSLTCGRLMNLKEKLVMVGGIGKREGSDIIKGIGIWVLKGCGWEEMARMPHKYFQGFGELDDVFASSGTEDLIFIQSYGAPALLVFDCNLKQWKWSQKCPMTKRFPLQLFTGFCFEPRLEIVP
ncbi:hypothetical protein OROHE_001054 [Orobanche hederae]